jgi:hypothetical protein
MHPVKENDPDRISGNCGDDTLESSNSTDSPTWYDATPSRLIMAEMMMNPQQQSLISLMQQVLLQQQQLLQLPFGSPLHSVQLQPGVISRFQQGIPIDPLLSLSYNTLLQQHLSALDASPAATAATTSTSSRRSSVGSCMDVAAHPTTEQNSGPPWSKHSVLEASNNRARLLSNASVSVSLSQPQSLSFAEQNHSPSKTKALRSSVGEPRSDPHNDVTLHKKRENHSIKIQNKNGIVVGTNKPKRPMSAYNVFFKEQREILLRNIPDKKEKECIVVEENDPSSVDNKDRPNEYGIKKLPAAAAVAKPPPPRRNRNPGRPQPHGKMGFEEMAKIIGHRWQHLNPQEKFRYQEDAKADRQRYESEKALWMQQHQETMSRKQAALEQSVDPTILVRYFESGGGAHDYNNTSPKKKKRRKEP